jgi:hypothetical protein
MFEATLMITSDQFGGTTHQVVVTGEGINPVSVSAPEVDFSRVFVGSVASRELTIANVGGVTLAMLLTSSGTAFEPLERQISIAAGEQRVVSVAFAPREPGEYGEELSFETRQVGPVFLAGMRGEAFALGDLAIQPDTITMTVSEGHREVGYAKLENPGTTEQYCFSGVYDAADTPRVFYDNFEDFQLDGWTAVAGHSERLVAVGDGAAESSCSYREKNAEGSHSSGIYRMFPSITPDLISFWIKPHSTSNATCFFTVHDADGHEAIRFLANRAGRLYCNASTGGDAGVPYAPDTWYHIELRDIDFHTKSFDYFVDGRLVKPGVSFRNAELVTEFTRIDLYNYTPGSGGSWDDILVSCADPAQWISTSQRWLRSVPGVDHSIQINIDATYLTEGEYDAVLCLATDHPYEPTMEVPVHVVVEPTTTGIGAHQPRQFTLYQNIPNPFNPATSISFEVPQAADVTLRVYNARGEYVRTLTEGRWEVGVYKATWDGTNHRGERVASGVYFCRFTAGDFRATRKMVLLK